MISKTHGSSYNQRKSEGRRVEDDDHAALAYFLEKEQKRVLVVDNDHQGNLTQYFGYNPVEEDEVNGSMYHIYTGERGIKEIAIGYNSLVKVASLS